MVGSFEFLMDNRADNWADNQADNRADNRADNPADTKMGYDGFHKNEKEVYVGS